jgi:long-chain acyl-CoA synthetase
MCAVIGMPIDSWGVSVHAIVVTRPGHEVSEEEIREHCRTLIANYKCPKSVEFREAIRWLSVRFSESMFHITTKLL